MGEVEVIQPGFYTTVQDMGRYGAACYGVPQSGVMDEFSAKKANTFSQASSLAVCR